MHVCAMDSHFFPLSQDGHLYFMVPEWDLCVSTSTSLGLFMAHL